MNRTFAPPVPAPPSHAPPKPGPPAPVASHAPAGPSALLQSWSALRAPGRGCSPLPAPGLYTALERLPSSHTSMLPSSAFRHADVRVHSGPDSAAMASAVGAKAFSMGRHIVLGDAPDRPVRGGGTLLQHELSHVAEARGDTMHLRRYEGEEHQDLGQSALGDLSTFVGTPAGREWAKGLGVDTATIDTLAGMKGDPSKSPGLIEGKIKVGDRALTPGEIIGLAGDFYRSPKALKGAPQKEIDEILAVTKDEREHNISRPKANEKYQEITGKYREREDTYLRLASENESHFGGKDRADNDPFAAKTNRRTWRTHHEEALRLAGEATTEADMQEALLNDAFAAHFLTDAFASGHVIDAPRLLVEIDVWLANNTVPLSGQDTGMRTGVGIFTAAGVVSKLMLKNIHDMLNKDGVEIENLAGMKWKTYGDDNLGKAPETQKVAALAVFLSRQQILAARGKKLTKEQRRAQSDEIMKLMPSPASVDRVTDLAIQMIPRAAIGVPGLVRKQAGILDTGLAAYVGGVGSFFLAPLVRPLLLPPGPPPKDYQFYPLLPGPSWQTGPNSTLSVNPLVGGPGVTGWKSFIGPPTGGFLNWSGSF